MCHKCFGVGFIDEHLQGGTKLVHPCPACNKGESDSTREPRRLPGWIKRLPRAEGPVPGK
ncbi:hypothetical protein J7W19_01155 [Streptomyces mobaraensis NBRC 13819 = DSM 40847]|uniref:Uncharacterized protein n=1 Tax=Streptomyces mobaraensis TaxID=35621 RepID=A0A5N5VXC9_STRMB|nr:hypothetical protein [Streptomyces mobaraensis]KAB7833484.1 hypothetical protein FRZ00_33560 [Streptomyces mobaraensis]QTT72221.1 hypothetical protein J7W19_01155 [Streptomyces mobaraensis NBRC 13819 = DSM 40847]